MADYIYVEIKPHWMVADANMFFHQVYEGHRWTIDNPSPEKVERLLLLLRGVGTVSQKFDVCTPLIEVIPTQTSSQYVLRVQSILASLFGR